MYQPLDGPSLQNSVSVDSTTVQKLPSGSELTERKVITIQPLDGKIWVYFGDGSTTPSAATVAADGFEHGKKAIQTYEASDSQPIFILAQSGTVDVRYAERA